MKRVFAPLLEIGLLLIVPAALSAEEFTAYTKKSVNLRAGPSRDYPLVARLPYDVPVQVTGCVDDWTWCDVIAWGDRGWVYAGNLEFPYRDRRVVVLDSGPLIGFPIVTFSIGPYWDNYYRNRPWYGRRSYWIHRAPPPHWIGRPGRPRPSRPIGIRPPGDRPHREPRPSVRPPEPRPPVVRPQRDVPRPIQPRPQEVRPQRDAPRPIQPRPQDDKRRGRPDGH